MEQKYVPRHFDLHTAGYHELMRDYNFWTEWYDNTGDERYLYEAKMCKARAEYLKGMEKFDNMSRRRSAFWI